MQGSKSVRGLTALLVMAMLVPATVTAKKPWENFKFDKLREIQMPGYERHELENGMVIFLMRDTAWPLVEGEAIVRTGSVYEPANLVGLASVTGDVLRTGGTTNIAADDLDAKLEAMGAYIESGIGESSGSVSFSFVDKDAQEGLGLVADVLRNPAFDQEKIDIALTAQKSGISRRNDEMNGIVAREIQKAVWGADHPYARTTEYQTLAGISRDEILRFYEYFYAPNNVMLAVWGNFEPAEMLAQLRSVFGDWKRVDNPIPQVSNEPTASATRRVLVANKDDVTQARFAVGQVGMRMDDPDYYAMSVMNRVLGGGFGDRLFNEVRSNLGLSYNVGSTSGAAMSRPGTFQAYCGTKNGTTDKALGAVLGEIDKMREGEVTEAELQNAKDAILNSHVFNFASKSQILERIVNYEYLGYPADYLESYFDKVRAVDRKAVQDVAKRRLDPDKFAIVAVGKTAEFDGDLSSYGPVETLDISIPEPVGEEFPEPTDETIERGRAILAAGQKAMGGSKLSSLQSLRRSEAISLTVQGMNFAATVTNQAIYPDRSHTAIQLPFGEMLQVLDGESGWAKGPQGMQDMSSEDVADSRNQMLQDPHYILGRFDGYQVQSLDAGEVDGKPANVVLIRIDEKEWTKLFFDATSGLLVKTESMGKNPMTGAPGLMESFFSDYKAVGGIQFAHTTKVVHGGEPLMELKTSSVEVNPKIESAIFAKPAS